MAVKLDLTRDLPKVREQYRAVLRALTFGRCDYTAPCVVGAMVPQSERASLESLNLGPAGDTTIGFLIRKKQVVVPAGQARDFTALQKAFDGGDVKRFAEVLKRVEAKYLGEQEASNAAA